MARELKVFSWHGYRWQAREEGNHHGGTTEVVAAYSKAEARRITGVSEAEWKHGVGETGNDIARMVALLHPGVHIWQPTAISRSVQREGWRFASDNSPVDVPSETEVERLKRLITHYRRAHTMGCSDAKDPTRITVASETFEALEAALARIEQESQK